MTSKPPSKGSPVDQPPTDPPAIEPKPQVTRPQPQVTKPASARPAPSARASRESVEANASLAGQLLVAMPQMSDPRFARTVIYMCAHSSQGAMGLVVNRVFDKMSFPELLSQLNIESGPQTRRIRIHAGGPVESAHGFVLHSDDYVRQGTMRVTDGIALTATVDILKAIAEGDGPRHSLLALGYAGWGPGQLESEIIRNSWLTVPSQQALVFSSDVDRVWERALAILGANPTTLSGEAGHA
jgi:putative transcriptional regulator